MAAERRATYADLEAVPEHLVAEIIDGELMTHPRPTPRHTIAASALNGALISPFQNALGGPGGWIFATEPELHLERQVVVPDLAAWRRERLDLHPEAKFIETPPDWICEVLSPSTEKRDRTVKRRIYGEAGVRHLWHLDPRQELLETFLLQDKNWILDGTWTSDDDVRAAPFDAISFPLANLWPFDRPLGFNESPQAPFIGDR